METGQVRKPTLFILNMNLSSYVCWTDAVGIFGGIGTAGNNTLLWGRKEWRDPNENEIQACVFPDLNLEFSL